MLDGPQKIDFFSSFHHREAFNISLSGNNLLRFALRWAPKGRYKKTTEKQIKLSATNSTWLEFKSTSAAQRTVVGPALQSLAHYSPHIGVLSVCGCTRQLLGSHCYHFMNVRASDSAVVVLMWLCWGNICWMAEYTVTPLLNPLNLNRLPNFEVMF